MYESVTLTSEARSMSPCASASASSRATSTFAFVFGCPIMNHTTASTPFSRPRRIHVSRIAARVENIHAATLIPTTSARRRRASAAQLWRRAKTSLLLGEGVNSSRNGTAAVTSRSNASWLDDGRGRTPPALGGAITANGVVVVALSVPPLALSSHARSS